MSRRAGGDRWRCRRVRGDAGAGAALSTRCADNGFALVEGFLLRTSSDGRADGAVAPLPEARRTTSPIPGDTRSRRRSQFAGVEEFPYSSWDLNRLAFHPDLRRRGRTLSRDERNCTFTRSSSGRSTADAVDYDQPLHRDYGSHSLVVPRPDGAYQQITTFIYLSDVTATKTDPPASCPSTPARRSRSPRSTSRFGALADAEFEADGTGGDPADVPDGHPAPRVELHRGRSVPVFAPRGLPGPGYDLGREDGVAEAVATAMGQAHAPLLGEGARSLRLPTARRRLLVASRRWPTWPRRYPGMDMDPYRTPGPPFS